MQSIKYNQENHLILNQIYDILAELQNQNKQIILYKVPTHIRIKGNKEADKATKQLGMITTRQYYIDYYLTVRRATNFQMAEGVGKQYQQITLHQTTKCRVGMNS